MDLAISSEYKHAYYERDLELYLYRKILIEKWRDDLPIPLTQLSFSNNTLEQICYALWHLEATDMISISGNTKPDDIMVESDSAFGYILNWPLIKSLDSKPSEMDPNYGLDIEILEEGNLKEMIDEEVNEFISNKASTKHLEEFRDHYGDPDNIHFKIPSHVRGIGENIYSYRKQSAILLRYILNLYEEFENEILVVRFKDFTVANVNILRTILALEYEGYFSIVELSNNKRMWIDEDDVYAKLKFSKPQLSKLKKSLIGNHSADQYDENAVCFTEDENLASGNKVYYGLTDLQRRLCKQLFTKSANFSFKTFDIEESVYGGDATKDRQDKLKKLVERINQITKREFCISKFIVYSASTLRRLI